MTAPLTSADSRLAELLEALPDLRVSNHVTDRIAYARDLWPGGQIEKLAGIHAPEPPACVVWPKDTAQLVQIVQWAKAKAMGEVAGVVGGGVGVGGGGGVGVGGGGEGGSGGGPVVLVPFGAGSGVCGGTMAGPGSIIVDLKEMDSVLRIEPQNNLVRAQGGIIGWHLEDRLNMEGLTLGHFPSSLMCSTLGGYLATRSAGQCSSLYGKIEDMAVTMEVVTGTGEVLETGRDSGGGLGPSWTQLFIGSEGSLGFITEATLKVHPAPAHRMMHGYGFKRVSAGCEAIRRLMQAGLRPSVVRLYDEFDTVMARSSAEKGSEADSLLDAITGHVKGSGAMPWLKRKALQMVLTRPDVTNRLIEELAPRVSADGCLLVVGWEGDERLTEVQSRLGHTELMRSGGKDLGEDPGWHWFKHRYAVSYKQSKLFTSGAFVDTMEVAATWDRLMDLYEGVRKAISPFAFVMAHFSHAYPEGCSIYFSFVGPAADPTRTKQQYDRLWRKALAAATRAGGTISHHHGVGRSKAHFMTEEHGTSLRLLRTLKSTFDPASILNPGVLGLS